MPQDFYDLWELCKEWNPHKPQGLIRLNTILPVYTFLKLYTSGSLIQM